MTNNTIKVGFLISYDYEYLKNSLPLVYEHVEYIAIAIDKKRLTWSGNSFHIPDEFFDWLKSFDTDKKIRIYEDDFYVPELTSLECDTRERTMLGVFMGKGGWHVQVDSDEYFLDFKFFKEYLNNYVDYNIETVVLLPFYTIYKQDDNGFYIVVDSTEFYPIATNNPIYTKVRYTDCKNYHVLPSPILHQSWGKDAEQIKKKIENWGHKNDFDTEAYFRLWDFVDQFTYKYIKNFHPIVGEVWRSLEYINATSLTEVIDSIRQKDNESKQKSSNSRLSFKDFLPPIYYRLKKNIQQKLKYFQ